MDNRATPHSATNDLGGSARVSSARDPNFVPSNSKSKHPTSSSRKQRKRHAAKRRRDRRPSFAVSEEPETDTTASKSSPQIDDKGPTPRPSLLDRGASSCSMESDSLLDHRHQQNMRPRQKSLLAQSFGQNASGSSSPQGVGDPLTRASTTANLYGTRSFSGGSIHSKYDDDDDDMDEVTDQTPFLSRSHGPVGNPRQSTYREPKQNSLPKSPHTEYDVNNPPSIPSSPVSERDPARPLSSAGSANTFNENPFDTVINVEDGADLHSNRSHEQSVAASRRRAFSLPPEEDVCLPPAALSDMEERPPKMGTARRRRRRRPWPDLAVLEEWNRHETGERQGAAHSKQIHEPVTIGGRWRPRGSAWRRSEEDVPYRFTYFNEELESTIHSQTISELLQPGQTFRDLFIPEPPVLDSDLSDYSDEDETPSVKVDSEGNATTKQPHHAHVSDNAILRKSSTKEPNPVPRPTFWLDVLSPTDKEMKILAKTFGIHALTVEDILMQEAREKVELFRSYYLINYRTFEQDPASEHFLEPVNVYVIVFREGLLSFHFSMIPHPANVRRRMRQVKDYLILSSDWIAYALIDDITDVFGPMIHTVEDEVDAIDDLVLRLYDEAKEEKLKSRAGFPEPPVTGSEMLRRVGECRKKVMGLYRLLGNKADVVKGFSKRCNEYWDDAPRTEIGLYLGDIQDHIVTMTSNLGHYETLLSRAHSNYLAQININMNERQEQTADVLGKLTVLGTIVLPMNIVTGMWGMNVKVPGQDVDNLHWFIGITVILLGFGIVCVSVAKRVYGIV